LIFSPYSPATERRFKHDASEAINITVRGSIDATTMPVGFPFRSARATPLSHRHRPVIGFRWAQPILRRQQLIR
jgi:hypothetical protein